MAPAVAVVAWGGNHFSPLLLMYRRIDGYTALEVDLVFAAYIVGIIPGFLFAGPLSDRYGRKGLVVASVVLGMAGSAILGFGSADLAALFAGRFVSGVSVAFAMVVGTTWIKELSAGEAVAATGARRASLTLTAGFGLGAAVAGVLAQWGPDPVLLPYAVQVALSLLTGVLLIRAPETRAAETGRRSAVADLRIPAAARRRFFGVVLPLAPWVFGAPALAFAVGPSLVEVRLGGDGIAFATLLTVVCLGCGIGVQSAITPLQRALRGRQGVLGLCCVVVGAALLAVAALLVSPVLTVPAAAVLGVGYGICLVSGLIDVQAMAPAESLAGLTAVYYSLTYVGFVLPAVLSLLATSVPYPVLLVAVAVLCAGSAVVVAARIRLPAAGA